MAENESLDVGGPYAKRWDIPFHFIQKGASRDIVARKVETALYGGLRNAVKQIQTFGISVAELLDKRNSYRAMRALVHKAKGHQYVQHFAAAAASSGPGVSDCLREWVNAILDPISDQICHRFAGTANWPTLYDIQEFMQDVRHTLEPTIERIVSEFEIDPSWKPKRLPRKGTQANSTAELMPMSLLRIAK